MPPASPESGPDFSSFEGGAGAAGGIIGTNQLQTAIDKFTQAVDKLDTVASKMGSAGGGGAGSTLGAGTAGTFPRPLNPFMAGPSVPYPRPEAGPGTPEASTPVPVMPNAGAPVLPGVAAPAGGNAGGSVITPTGTLGGGGNGQGGQQQPAPRPSGGGSGGGGGFNAAGMAGAAGAGMGAGGGMVGSYAKTALGYAPAPIAAAITGLASAGANDMPSQIALNTLQFQTSLSGQNYQTTRAGAMGTMGNVMGGQQQVEWGMNPSDMAASYASLQQTTTNVNPYAASFGGRNVMAGMGAMNIANPAMSGQQNAGAMGQLYDPATSLRMMQMGYPVTPRQAGTGAAQPMPNVMAPFLNRLGGGKAMTQAQLFAQMQPGQRGYVGLQNLTGADPTQMQQYSTSIEMQNTLMTGGPGGKQQKMSLDQVNTIEGQLASSNVNTFKTAQGTLQKYGINQSDIQAMKSKAGGQAANISDTSSGFTAGLQASTRALSDFNTALHKIINSVPGGWGQKALGFGESVAANIFGGGAAGPSTRAGDTGTSKASAAKQSSTVNARAGQAVQIAKTQLGVPYAYGMESPGQGFDCSALPQWAYKAAGVTLPRTAADQLRFLSSSLVSPQHVQEGDLVFQPGVGPTAHEAMLVDNGRTIIEAKGVGTQISTRKYNPGEWIKAARPWNLGKGSASKNAPAKGASKTNVTGGGTGHGSGAQVAAYAETFATGLKHPYVWGGASASSGWDCSGFVADVYEHFGYVPGNGAQRWGNTTTQFADTKYLQNSGPVVGALVYEAGSDGTTGAPGHVGIMTGPGKMVAAADPAQGTVNQVPQGVSGYRIPKGGFNGTGGAAPAGGTTAAKPAAASGSSGGGGLGGGLSGGLGDYSTEGSTSELSAFSSAILGGGLGGSTSAPTKATTTTGTSGASGASATTPGGTTSNLTGNKKILNQAAAKFGWGTGKEWTALDALEMQEAGYNNLAQNPTSTAYGMGQFLNSTWAPYGPKTSDAALQSKYMMEYIKGTYHDPIKAEAHEIADHWYGAGGSPKAGSSAWVGERGPELVSFTHDAHVHTAAESTRLAQSMAGVAQGPYSSGPHGGYKYSQAHPLFGGGGSSGGGSGGISISFAPGSIVVGAPGSATGAGMTVTGNSGAVMAQTFAKQLKAELGKLNLAGAIGSGVSS
jgi:cell wall-associated NlpC family hydrolase